MTIKDAKRYPGKVLLYGEYTVLHGSRALAIPAHAFGGQWRFADQGKDPELAGLLTWLRTTGAGEWLDLGRLSSDIERGLFFDSDIPHGYGAGSSGALTAAVLDRYTLDRTAHNDIAHLHDQLTKIENRFHGRSSGLDPLVSSLDSAVLKENGSFMAVQLPVWPVDFHAALVDSGSARDTGALVSNYNSKLSDRVFEMQILDRLRPAVDHAVAFHLSGQWDILWEYIRLISEIQFELMREFILDDILPLWEESMRSDKFRIKLCGAGGGGFYLAFGREDGFLPHTHLPVLRLT